MRLSNLLSWSVTILLTVVFSQPLLAADKPSYDALAAKADRFYQHEEWASAAALYKLMIEARPAEASLYGRAIVTEAMREKPQEEIVLFRKALANHVPFDSVFASVERESFGLGQTDLYERFMENVKSSEPWLKRTVNGYLLRYFSYRHNPDGMIEYSKMLLQGAPDNQSFLYTLAQGYLLKGDFKEAMDTYSRIVSLDPNSYESLLYLGNYYASSSAPGSRQLAQQYLSRADSLRSTPYLCRTLTHLKALTPR